jgi:hypothetical protein
MSRIMSVTTAQTDPTGPSPVTVRSNVREA